jgi:hypothetical protein
MHFFTQPSSPVCMPKISSGTLEFAGLCWRTRRLFQPSSTPSELRRNSRVYSGLRGENFFAVLLRSAIRSLSLAYAGLLCTTRREFVLQLHSLRHTPKYAGLRCTTLHYSPLPAEFAFSLPRVFI